ncbi:hypothetical protein BLGI_3396 [Brevibacillus laterosporus GI-9]|uniref:DUF3238 domain-containing protein n=1 Tax=Brevibacillus laterosporus TaxID=1465 RepID=UPI0002403E20|nr:DUF3238 domain-containing protein [Brevibacillus laterosporus]CCF15454.1 hypothetical protein BLGI_3396 [Brevibacillus laterosporus GI-9]
MGNFIITFKTFIPEAKIEEPVWGHWYKGDNRGFDFYGSYRTKQKIVINFDNKTIEDKPYIGETHNLTTGETGTAPTSDLKLLDVQWSGSNQVKFKVVCSSKNPLVKGAPAIDYEFKVTFKSDGTGFIEGLHDGFPNYEVYINTSSSLGRNKNVIYTYGHKNESPRALFPPMDKGVSRRPFAVRIGK